MIIYKYFIYPMVSKTGYNLVNTVVYAIIAILSIYAIYRYILKKYGIKIDKYFIYGIISFVLFGSTKRVITDLVDSGVMGPISPLHAWILESHIYDYNFFNISPGIYIFVGLLFVVSLILFRKLNNVENLYKFGLVLWASQIIVLIPFMKYIIPAGLPIIALAIVGGVIGYVVTRKNIATLAVFSQSLDGAATFFSIDFGYMITGVRYFEQHVVSNGICAIFNTCFTFYAIKMLMTILVAHIIEREGFDENEKHYIYSILIVIGLAPGFRDILRFVCGG